jgi:hypothetical protein
MIEIEPIIIVEEENLTEDQLFERELSELRSKVTIPYLQPLPPCM